MIDPALGAMIQAKREGKSDNYAALTYCYAKSVIPVQVHSDGRLTPIHWQEHFGFLAAFDAFDEGVSDEDIAAAFKTKPDWEESPVRFKAMEHHERPTFDKLIGMLDVDELVTASRFFGIKRVAQGIIAAKDQTDGR